MTLTPEMLALREAAIEAQKFDFTYSQSMEQMIFADLATPAAILALLAQLEAAPHKLVGYLLYDNHGGGNVETYFRKNEPEGHRLPALQWYAPLYEGPVDALRLAYLASGTKATP